MGYWCFYLLYLVLVHQSICQTTDPTSFENLAKTIDKYAKEVLACNGSEVVSLALTVVKNGTTVLAKSYGYADYVKKIKATDETKFCIASCSKAFTTTLLAKLLDRNKSHTFDSKVKDILPDLLLGDNYTTYHVTIRDLVSHRTGMSRHDFAWVLGGLTRDTFFRHIQYMNATYGFRDQVIYNNWMYGIASRVAEALGGKPFQVLLQEEILDPLDMKRTTQIYDLKPEGKDYAKFYYVTDEGPKEVDVQLYSTLHAVDGAGGLCSTPTDMSKWLTFHLSNGVLPNGTQLVSNVSLDNTKTSRNIWGEVAIEDDLYTRPKIPFTDVRDRYAMGWYAGYYRGYRTISHAGSLYGQLSLITTIPAESIAIYTTTSGNLKTNPQRAMSLYIADILMGLEPWLNASTTCTFPFPWIISSTNQTSSLKRLTEQRPLVDYTGTFGNYFYGNITVAMGTMENSTDKVLKFLYGSLGNFPLLPTEDKDVFKLYASPTNLFWFLNYTSEVKVNFSSSEPNRDIIDTMTVSGIDTNTTVFLRDLKLPPRTNTNCGKNGENCSTSGSFSIAYFAKGIITIFAAIALGI